MIKRFLGHSGFGFDKKRFKPCLWKLLFDLIIFKFFVNLNKYLKYNSCRSLIFILLHSVLPLLRQVPGSTNQCTGVLVPSLNEGGLHQERHPNYGTSVMWTSSSQKDTHITAWPVWGAQRLQRCSQQGGLQYQKSFPV